MRQDLASRFWQRDSAHLAFTHDFGLTCGAGGYVPPPPGLDKSYGPQQISMPRVPLQTNFIPQQQPQPTAHDSSNRVPQQSTVGNNHTNVPQYYPLTVPHYPPPPCPQLSTTPSLFPSAASSMRNVSPLRTSSSTPVCVTPPTYYPTTPQIPLCPPLYGIPAIKQQHNAFMNEHFCVPPPPTTEPPPTMPSRRRGSYQLHNDYQIINESNAYHFTTTSTGGTTTPNSYLGSQTMHPSATVFHPTFINEALPQQYNAFMNGNGNDNGAMVYSSHQGVMKDVIHNHEQLSSSSSSSINGAAPICSSKIMVPQSYQYSEQKAVAINILGDGSVTDVDLDRHYSSTVSGINPNSYRDALTCGYDNGTTTKTCSPPPQELESITYTPTCVQPTTTGSKRTDTGAAAFVIEEAPGLQEGNGPIRGGAVSKVAEYSEDSSTRVTSAAPTTTTTTITTIKEHVLGCSSANTGEENCIKSPVRCTQMKTMNGTLIKLPEKKERSDALSWRDESTRGGLVEDPNLERPCTASTSSPKEESNYSGFNAIAACRNKEDLYRRIAKTKMCVHFLVQKCTRGTKCTFAHSKDELRPLPNLLKTRMCTKFVYSKSCERGDTCCYAHGMAELRERMFSAENENSRQLMKSNNSSSCSLSGDGSTRFGRITPPLEKNNTSPARIQMSFSDVLKYGGIEKAAKFVNAYAKKSALAAAEAESAAQNNLKQINGAPETTKTTAMPLETINEEFNNSAQTMESTPRSSDEPKSSYEVKNESSLFLSPDSVPSAPPGISATDFDELDEEPLKQIDVVKSAGSRLLDSLISEDFGSMVPSRVHASLTNATMGDDDIFSFEPMKLSNDYRLTSVGSGSTRVGSFGSLCSHGQGSDSSSFRMWTDAEHPFHSREGFSFVNEKSAWNEPQPDAWQNMAFEQPSYFDSGSDDDLTGNVGSRFIASMERMLSQVE